MAQRAYEVIRLGRPVGGPYPRYLDSLAEQLSARLPAARLIALETHAAFQETFGIDYRGLLDDALIVRAASGLVVIDFQDSFASPAFHLSAHPAFAGAFLAMYDRAEVAARFGLLATRVWPGWFLDYSPAWTAAVGRPIAAGVRQSTVRDQRLLFAGTLGAEDPTYPYVTADGRPWREVAYALARLFPDETLILDRTRKQPREAWWALAARHRAVLALAGHPWCYREHECWSLGLPVLALRWRHERYLAPIPDYHYLAVDQPVDQYGRAVDPEQAAMAIMARFRLADDDELEAVGRAGRAYYDQAVDPNAVADQIAQAVTLRLG